jgi:hypothetical protein
MTTTANKLYTLPTIGGDLGTWGNETNANWTILDANLGGVASYALTNSNVSVTNSQAQNLVQKLTGTLTGNVNFVLPALQSFYIIQNNTSGAYQVNVLTATSGSYGFPVAQGVSQQIWTDGTNVYPVGRGMVGPNATLSLYVSPFGSDSNNGLSPGSPFLTMQKAWNTLAARYDGAGGNGQINLVDGTYTTGLTTAVPAVGFNTVAIVGDVPAPLNCLVSVTNAPCFAIQGPGVANVSISGVKMVSSGIIATNGYSGSAVCARGVTQLLVGNVEFGACSANHLMATPDSAIAVNGNYTISGGAGVHYSATNGGFVFAPAPYSVTLTGTPAFSQFAYANVLGCVTANLTFSGSATGQKYIAGLSSAINTNNAGPNYFPGSSAGSVFGGGQYL